MSWLQKVFTGLGASFISFFLQAQEAMPLAEKMRTELDNKGVFDWIRDLISNTTGLIFFGIGIVVFVVGLGICIKFFLDWKNKQIDTMELGQNLIIVAVAMVVMFVLLTFAYDWIGA